MCFEEQGEYKIVKKNKKASKVEEMVLSKPVETGLGINYWASCNDPR